jgi:hypothetical protein
MEADMSRAKILTILLTLGVVLVLVLGACKPEPVATALTAALSELQGSVSIDTDGGGDFEAATSESILQVNGQIQTGDDGRARLDLSSGTIVRVAPSSLFTLTSNEEVEGGLATKIKLDLGQVFIILNGGSAEVETPSGVASVRGSIIQVGVDPVTGDVVAYCVEGDCTAGNGAGSVDFSLGQKVVLYYSETGEWTLPIFEEMTPEEIQKILDENPDLLELLTELFNQQNPPEPPPPAPPGDGGDGNGNGNGDGEGDGEGNGGDACFSLLEPPPGAELPHQGREYFTWEPQEGASYYVFTFTNEEGDTISFDPVTETEFSKYIEILPDAGSYSWSVTAYGEDGSEICTAESASFSKPDSNPEGSTRDNKGTCDPCNPSSGCFDPYNPICDQ